MPRGPSQGSISSWAGVEAGASCMARAYVSLGVSADEQEAVNEGVGVLDDSVVRGGGRKVTMRVVALYVAVEASILSMWEKWPRMISLSCSSGP